MVCFSIHSGIRLLQAVLVALHFIHVGCLCLQRKGMVLFMRLDKWLKVSRLIKRRTVANEACDNGLVFVNGKPQRASYDVKVGDSVELHFGAKTLKVEVLVTSEHVTKADSPAMYKQLGT